MKDIMLLNHFTWMQYLEALAVLLLIYYGVILAKYYLPELQQKINGTKPAVAAPISALQFNEQPSNEQEEPLLTETEQLIAQLKQSIHRGYEPAEIKKILQNHPVIKDTPLRPAINELVVTECEKTDAALLTEAEVNEWWEA
ncbi:hypothetical protein ACFS5N_05600 [Mucilaginibacter ximonensis]|uniref:Uncharacterized protein n=1 Tax=Mucilaginibacter ximonensis TaxID=538021 RepID=A0ABW5Y9B8_9SPHI